MDATHFYIIGGLHNMIIHKLNIENSKLLASDCTVTEQLKITFVWAPASKHDILVHLSRVLNQDIVDNRNEKDLSCIAKHGPHQMEGNGFANAGIT